MVKAIWKTISLLMGLIAFVVVGTISQTDGEEPLWIVARAFGAFVICWIVMGNLGNYLIDLTESASARHHHNEEAEEDKKKAA